MSRRRHRSRRVKHAQPDDYRLGHVAVARDDRYSPIIIGEIIERHSWGVTIRNPSLRTRARAKWIELDPPIMKKWSQSIRDQESRKQITALNPRSTRA